MVILPQIIYITHTLQREFTIYDDSTAIESVVINKFYVP